MTGTIPEGAIDFRVPPHLRDLLDEVRAYVEQDVLPAEREVEDPRDLLGSWHVVERLRSRGVTFTQPPTEMGPVKTAVFDDTCGNLIQIASQP